MTLEEFYRILDSIEPNADGCKIWPCKALTSWYRKVTITGAERRIGAHRLALARKLGRPIRKGFHALHTCDEPSCVNPDHLYEGSDADNTRDKMERNPEARAHIQQLGKRMGPLVGPTIGKNNLLTHYKKGLETQRQKHLERTWQRIMQNIEASQ